MPWGFPAHSECFDAFVRGVAGGTCLHADAAAGTTGGRNLDRISKPLPSRMRCLAGFESGRRAGERGMLEQSRADGCVGARDHAPAALHAKVRIPGRNLSIREGISRRRRKTHCAVAESSAARARPSGARTGAGWRTISESHSTPRMLPVRRYCSCMAKAFESVCGMCPLETSLR